MAGPASSVAGLMGLAASTPPNPMALRALAQAKALGVPASDVFVPRAAASPAQAAQSQLQGHVTPLYGGNGPAPIGLADFGLFANPNGNGSVLPSLLNTQSVKATFQPNSTGIQPLYPFSSTPDGYGVQLNAVTTDVSLFGTTNYSFWTQNVVEYLAQTHELIFITNVWNFSGPSLSANVFYAHGPYGTQVGTTFYYALYVVPTPVTYPFGLSLWMNNSVVSGRNAVNFTVALNESGVTTSYPYDYVIFNSTTTTSGPAPPSSYTANGYQLNPIGLTDDFEVILGGPGGGSQANLFAADATFTLQYWNTSTSSYHAVPSAYSYGGETGETVTGAYVGWQNGTNGAPVGVVRTGPAILHGLWNATGAPGLGKVHLTLSPENAFLFFATNWTSNFTYEGLPYWAPQETTSGTFWLAPGKYNFTAVLSDYSPVALAVVVTLGTTSVVVTLPVDSLLGIYTPLWAWNNAQFAAISTGGTGTPSNPYQIVHAQSMVMSSIFGTWNDFGFPVFTGVFFFDTTASVVMSHMAPLVTAVPYTLSAPTDALGYVLYNSSNVALVNSTQISGWYPNGLYYPVDSPYYAGNYYGTFSAVLWDSSNNLIANDTFATQSGGLSLYGGTNNTVWGNTFTMVPFPVFPSPTVLSGLNLSLGLQEDESGDLVYDNAFDTTVTAVTEPFDLYSGAPTTPLETWNITPTPAATVHFATHFPDFPLTGTIVGNTTQGGNFWWDYGGTSNPIGTLPYTEVVGGIHQIITGGDHYPLVPPPPLLYPVTWTETSLPSGTSWSINLTGTHPSTNSTVRLDLSNGTYLWSVGAVSGYTSSPQNGTLVLAGAAANIALTFTSTSPPKKYGVAFTETGLPSGTTWALTLGTQSNSSTTGSVTFDESNGTYNFSVGTVTGYVSAPSSGQVTVLGAAVSRSVAFTTAGSTVAFAETGLTTGTNWSVTLTGPSGASTRYSNGGTVVTFHEANASYNYTVNALSGYTIAQATGILHVTGSAVTVSVTFAPVTYTLTFTESGLPTKTNWSVTVGIATHDSNGSATVTFQEPNGSYTYSVGTVGGYTASPASGPVTLTGAGTAVSVTFTSSGGSSSSLLGLSTLDWVILGIVLAIIVIALILALAMRGRGGSRSATTTESSTTTTSQTTTTPEARSEETPPGTSP